MGELCEEQGCPGEDGACSGHGSCNSALGMCTCYPGFKGDDCASPACPGTPECSGKNLSVEIITVKSHCPEINRKEI